MSEEVFADPDIIAVPRGLLQRTVAHLRAYSERLDTPDQSNLRSVKEAVSDLAEVLAFLEEANRDEEVRQFNLTHPGRFRRYVEIPEREMTREEEIQAAEELVQRMLRDAPGGSHP